MYFDQSDYDIRCEWGEQGVVALGPHCVVVIIIDVLSTDLPPVAFARHSRIGWGPEPSSLIWPALFRWRRPPQRLHMKRLVKTLAVSCAVAAPGAS